jgi:hypothetical protein
LIVKTSRGNQTFVTKKRNFNILDAVVLVAATAVGIAGVVAIERRPRSPFDGPASLAERVHESCGNLTFLLLAWGLAFLLLRLRSPRPRLRRLFRSPGAAACATVFVVMFVELALKVISWQVDEIPILGGMSMGCLYKLRAIGNGEAGAAIIAIWVVLVLSRGLKLNRDWLEIFGCLLAGAWILLMLHAPFWSLR